MHALGPIWHPSTRAVHVLCSALAHCQLYFLQICILTALFKYLKWKESNPPWWRHIQCLWLHNLVQGATPKFKFHQKFFTLSFGPNHQILKTPKPPTFLAIRYFMNFGLFFLRSFLVFTGWWEKVGEENVVGLPPPTSSFSFSFMLLT